MTLYNYARLTLCCSCVLLNMVQYCIFPQSISNYLVLKLLYFVLYISNTKITVHGSLPDDKRLLIMSNHYDGLDFLVIRSLFQTKVQTVVKADLVGNPKDNNMLLSLLYYVKSTLIKSCGFIPYKRGDREDGALVKNNIVDKLQNGTHILIFPEGTTTKNGVPQGFKNGIFHLAIHNELTILPVTLKYALDIGWAEGESVNLFKWFDNHVDVYIHPLVDCGKEADFQTLKDKVFNTICEPVIKKVEQQGQT